MSSFLFLFPLSSLQQLQQRTDYIMSVESIESVLKGLSLYSEKVLEHSSPANNEEWETLLQNQTGKPETYELTKTLVFKPKTPKSQDPVPVVLVALNNSATPSSAVGKAVDAKDLRLAKSDLVKEFFGESTEPKDIGPLNLIAGSEKKIKVVLDAKLKEAEFVAIHTQTADKTVFVNGAALAEQLKKALGETDLVELDFTTVASTASAPTETAKKVVVASKEDAKIDGAALIGITVDKELDFPGWYQQILTKGEMLDYYDVSGCYIMRPASYSIWEKIQDFFNQRIKSIGVQNTYFPMFVSSKVLEKEKDHIEGFAPEVAWVTKAGKSELEEPIAIRPTSETVMYPYYAKWIRSHRDLPLKLNQWNSVVRWEFKHPQPFLRTREFLWQEGHTAHLTFEEANEEVHQILEWYEAVYTDILAVPVIKGKKTENEKFAGGYFTTTVEGYIPSTGRGIQGATSHCLGQNFSKMFNISVENPEGPEKPKVFAWQNSWGLSTRVIGVMVMVHSDNKGLVLPPNAAEIQSVVIPCGLTAKTSDAVKKEVKEGVLDIEHALKKAGVRITSDLRENYSPGWKFADWELRGVPLRIEYGPQDHKKKQIVAVRRDNGEKSVIPLDDNLGTALKELLATIHKDMFNRAKESFDSHRIKVTSLEEFVPALNKKCVLLAPFCGGMECEDDIKDRTAKQGQEGEDVDDKAPSMGAKSLCIPFEQEPLPENAKCVGCGMKAEFWTMFGRSY